jgi:hypothetical protein
MAPAQGRATGKKRESELYVSSFLTTYLTDMTAAASRTPSPIQQMLSPLQAVAREIARKGTVISDENLRGFFDENARPDPYFMAEAELQLAASRAMTIEAAQSAEEQAAVQRGINASLGLDPGPVSDADASFPRPAGEAPFLYPEREAPASSCSVGESGSLPEHIHFTAPTAPGGKSSNTLYKYVPLNIGQTYEGFPWETFTYRTKYVRTMNLVLLISNANGPVFGDYTTPNPSVKLRV